NMHRDSGFLIKLGGLAAARQPRGRLGAGQAGLAGLARAAGRGAVILALGRGIAPLCILARRARCALGNGFALPLARAAGRFAVLAGAFGCGTLLIQFFHSISSTKKLFFPADNREGCWPWFSPADGR